MSNQNDINIVVVYRGVKENLKIIKLDTASVMQPTIHHVPKELKKKVVSASVLPNSNIVKYKFSDGSTVDYNPDMDAYRFIVDWKLHYTAFVKDQYYDGLALSDWTYWSQQLRNYATSVTWGLINIVKLSPKEARRYTKMGIALFKQDLIAFRGVDLDREQTDEEKSNDFAIAQKQASKAFYDSQSLH